MFGGIFKGFFVICSQPKHDMQEKPRVFVDNKWLGNRFVSTVGAHWSLAWWKQLIIMYTSGKILNQNQKLRFNWGKPRSCTTDREWETNFVEPLSVTQVDFYWYINVLQLNSTKTVASDAAVGFVYWWKCRLKLLFSGFVAQWLRERVIHFHQ